MKNLIEFLFECLQLKHIKRSGWYYAGVQYPESVAEHSLHAAQIAFILAKIEGADPYKTASMLLWHDIGEIRIGDIHYLGRKYIKEKKSIEQQVIKDQISEIPMKNDIHALIDEYEICETLEGKIAKDADTLNAVFQCKIYMEEGHHLVEAYLHNFQFRLKTESAKKMYTEIL